MTLEDRVCQLEDKMSVLFAGLIGLGAELIEVEDEEYVCDDCRRKVSA